MFQSRDVDHRRNILRINDVDVFGGPSVSPARDAWNANILLVEPRHQLKPTGNVLHVESRTSGGMSTGDVDDFIIDNVIAYKNLDVSLPSAAGDLTTFLEKELLRSITNVKGSGDEADPADRHNEYVLDRVSIGRVEVTFRSLRVPGPRHISPPNRSAHLQRRPVCRYSVGSNPLHPHGRRTGQIPDPASHPSGVTITDLVTLRAEGGVYVFNPDSQRTVSLSAPHPKDDLETADEAIEAYLALQARTLHRGRRSRPEHSARALRTVGPSILRVGCGPHRGVSLSNGVRGDLFERRGHGIFSSTATHAVRMYF